MYEYDTSVVSVSLRLDYSLRQCAHLGQIIIYSVSSTAVDPNLPLWDAVHDLYMYV